jgi:hypothetical protein
MASIRRRLRQFVLATLSFQVASFSIFVPHCSLVAALASSAVGGAEHDHPSECPMRAADGAVCPMHRGQSGSGGLSKDKNDCSMASRSTVAPLMIALHYGILPVPADLSVDFRAIAAPPPEIVSVTSLLIPPDSPPPRG